MKIDTHAFKVAQKAYIKAVKEGESPLYLKQHLIRMIHINQKRT